MKLYIAIITFASVSINVDGQTFNKVLSEIKNNTASVFVANINCSIRCNEEMLYCDTMAIYPNGSFAKTLECPIRKLDISNKRKLIGVITNLDFYASTIQRGRVKFVEGQLACFNPTVAILFKNKDSTVFAQILIDLDCKQYILYFLEEFKFKIASNNSRNNNVFFYGEKYLNIKKIFYKYNLKCI